MGLKGEKLICLGRRDLVIKSDFPVLFISGKLLSTRPSEAKKKASSSGNSVKEFCGLMGWENPELLHEKGPIEKPQDFLTLTLAKEAGQKVNTHGLELKESLKPVSVRQRKKQNKVRQLK